MPVHRTYLYGWRDASSGSFTPVEPAAQCSDSSQARGTLKLHQGDADALLCAASSFPFSFNAMRGRL